ncbi:MAG TPA: beta-N-acetylhexosaminidase [Bacteroidaceae bacterium]|nr:beta-N-acetylhexosaminidase [Bacteroidaceae bacterium]
MKNLVFFRRWQSIALVMIVSTTMALLASEQENLTVHYGAVVPAPKQLTELTQDKGYTLSSPVKITVVEAGADVKQLEELKKNAAMLGEYIAEAMSGGPVTNLMDTTTVAQCTNDSTIVLASDSTTKKRTIEPAQKRWGEVITASVNPEKGIVIQLDKTIKNKEGYTLNVNQNRVLISGSTSAGVFYGMEMLRKIIYTAGEVKIDQNALANMDPYHYTQSVFTPLQMNQVVLGAVDIKDEPRFGYRGFMLDIARHFMGVKDLKKVIDLCALHQLNYLHLHLTDDQGWRIEIKRYPKLTEIGSQRDETVIGRNSEQYDGKPYGGFLTQEQVKELVRYALDRHITIVPEIDVPAHTLALLAAYPNLGCTGGPYKVGTKWGGYPDILCVGNPRTIPFVQGILDEIIALFPSPYIHIGGDEADKTRWKSCSKCQQLIRRLWIQGKPDNPAENQLQAHFIVQLEQYLNKKGRRIIGWDEILEGRLAPNATVMSWRGIKGGITAANMGHDVIMSPNTCMYFDHYQADKNTEPLAIGGLSPVQKVYEFNPIVSGLGSHEGEGQPVDVKKSQFKSILKSTMTDRRMIDTRQQDSRYLPTSVDMEVKKPVDHILGAQANLWTEYVPTTDYAYYMILPRMAALSEVVWCDGEKKNWKRFEKAMPYVMRMYEELGYNFAPHMLKSTGETAKNEK